MSEGVGVVEDERGGGMGRQHELEVALGEQHPSTGHLEHGGEALSGVGGVQGDVGAAGLEGGEDGEGEVERAVHADGDALVRPDAEGTQVVGELVGAAVQLTVREARVTEAGGDGVGLAYGLRLEEGVHGAQGGVGDRRVVPLAQ